MWFSVFWFCFSLSVVTGLYLPEPLSVQGFSPHFPDERGSQTEGIEMSGMFPLGYYSQQWPREGLQHDVTLHVFSSKALPQTKNTSTHPGRKIKRSLLNLSDLRRIFKTIRNNEEKDETQAKAEVNPIEKY